MFITQALRRNHAVNIILAESDWTSEARRTALEAAGLDEASVQFTNTAESEFLGRAIYEVEFSTGVLDYECYIDAETWEVCGMNYWPTEI